MKCVKCGSELRKLVNDEGYVCDKCNTYFKPRNNTTGTTPHNNGAGYRYSNNPQSNHVPPRSPGPAPNASTQGRPPKVQCPVCGSYRVDISFVQTGASTVTRNPGAPTKAGRKAMKASTLGLWGLTGKRTGYSSTAFHNQKMAICKDCGNSWVFFTEQEKARGKSVITAIIITALSLIFFFTFWTFEPNKKEKENQPVSYKADTVPPAVEAKGEMDDFEYELSGDQLKLLQYNGNNESLVIDADYKIQNVGYKTNLSNFQIGSGVRTLVISEGITEVYDAIFNSSDVEKVYLPKSLGSITDKALSYLHGDKPIELYYGGSEEQWNSILEHYVSPGVTESWKPGNYEDAGAALADKINKMVGSDYDPSKFNFHFNSNPAELIAP